LLLGTQRVTEDGLLEIGGVPAVELAERFGTPLYVIDEACLRDRCRRYRESFAAAYEGPTAIAYASKACLTLAMCRVVAEEGLHLDVASGGELHVATKAGFPLSKVAMHGNNKSVDEIAAAMDAGVGYVVVDCMEEIDRAERLLEAGHPKTKALLRITPGIKVHTHEYIMTGRADSKFGLGPGEGGAMKAVERLLKSPAFELIGFHCHIGSQLLAVDCFADAAGLMLDFCKSAQDQTGFVAQVLNLGGGLGVRHTDDEHPPTIPELATITARGVMEGCAERGLDLPTLMVEPGRSIVGEAGTLLYTVGVVKEIPGVRTYLAVDGGLSDNPRPALYDAEYEVFFAGKMNAPTQQRVTVAGKHCETDNLFKDVPAPEVEPGDVIAVPSCGGYTFAMASNYNRLPRPAMVHVIDGQADLVVERQTWENLLRGERIPERLA
jgi:diaminopimelate decarboxylase